MNDRVSGTFSEDPVERAAAALRDVPVPEGPPEELLDKTISRVGAGKMNLPLMRKNWWTMRVVRSTAMAAGIAVAVTAGIMWLLLGRGSAVAFADVVAQVKTAHAVRCKTLVEVDSPREAGGKQAIEAQALMVSPGWTITTSKDAKFVMSAEKRQILQLFPANKQATLIALKNLPAGASQTVNLLDTFKDVDGKEGKPLGEREIEGKQARGFEISRPGMEMKVWADKTTDLPVLVEVVMTSPSMVRTVCTMKDFDWNPTYEASELSLEVPAGYRAITMDMDASKPGEKDVTLMLKTLAEQNGGILPDNLGRGQLTRMIAQKMQAREGAETAGMTAEQKAAWRQTMTGEMLQQIMPVIRGWAFIGDTAQGTEWQYAGASVKVGEKGRAVLWYRVKGNGALRVVDADLTVHDGKEGELPKGEPVNLEFSLPVTTLPGAVYPLTTQPAQGK